MQFITPASENEFWSRQNKFFFDFERALKLSGEVA